jgi:hypothetical protein
VPVDHPIAISRAQVVARLLQRKIIPEIDVLGSGMASEARSFVVKIMLSLIHHERSKAAQWSVSTICQWHGESRIWRSSIEDTLRTLVRNYSVVFWVKLRLTHASI